MTQRNVRDPSVYLFVNEGNETGNLISGLCFPMAPLDADGPLLELGESGDGEGQAWYLEARACGRAGRPHATAGPTSWVNKLGTMPRDSRYASTLLLR